MKVEEVIKLINEFIKKSGLSPTVVKMYPHDYECMKQDVGMPGVVTTICGVPIEVDPECPPGKIYLL